MWIKNSFGKTKDQECKSIEEAKYYYVELEKYLLLLLLKWDKLEVDEFKILIKSECFNNIFFCYHISWSRVCRWWTRNDLREWLIRDVIAYDRFYFIYNVDFEKYEEKDLSEF